MAENIETPEITGQSQEAQTSAGGNAASKISSMLKGLQNFNVADFVKGKPGQWQKMAVVAVVVIIVMGLGAVMMWGLALWALANSFGDPRSSGAYVNGACYLSDEGFTYTNRETVGNTDWIIDKLSRYNVRRDKVEDIVNKSLQKNINPALLMAIWSGESSFKSEHDEAAFGCGVYDRDGDGHTENSNPSWREQLDCAFGPIQKAISGTESDSPYDKPEGQNMFTRLFYNYTGAMKNTYESKGYVADSENARIVILKILDPEHVVCVNNLTDSANSIFGIVDRSNLSSWYYNQGTAKRSGGGYWGTKQGTPGQCGGWPNGKIYAKSGCGITSAAMIARYHNKNIDPFQMGEKYCREAGSLDYNGWVVARAIGKKVIRKNNPSFEFIKSTLSSYGPMIARIQPGWGSSGGHYVVIAGIKGDKLLINDPASSDTRGKAGREVTWESRGNLKYVDYFK